MIHFICFALLPQTPLKYILHCCTFQNGPAPDSVKAAVKPPQKLPVRGLFSDDEDSQVKLLNSQQVMNRQYVRDFFFLFHFMFVFFS